jgi:hypothetical protein
MIRRFKCTACGLREAAAGGGLGFMCKACKAAGKYRSSVIAGWALLGRTSAGVAVSKAVKAGILPAVRTCACTDCGRPATEYEHRDYNKPIDVVPVCKPCNAKRGPAIPLHGSIQKMVGFGFVPYANKAHVAQMFAGLGMDAGPLDHLPKRLTHAAWVELLPAFDALDALGETA